MKIRSITDVITNSSTEVFIVKKDEIAEKDLKFFDQYDSEEQIYNIASLNEDTSNDDSWCQVHDLISNIYYYITYIYEHEYFFDINCFLDEGYDLGPLAKELKMSLVDVLKFLRPIWIGILDYGICTFADDMGGPSPHFSKNYKMTDRI